MSITQFGPVPDFNLNREWSGSARRLDDQISSSPVKGRPAHRMVNKKVASPREETREPTITKTPVKDHGSFVDIQSASPCVNKTTNQPKSKRSKNNK